MQKKSSQAAGDWIVSHFSGAGEVQLTRALIESLPGIFYVLDESAHMLDFNSRFSKLTGYSPEEMRSRHALDFTDISYKEAMSRSIEKARESGEASMQAPIRTKAGELIPFFLTGRTVTIDGTTYIVGMGVDLTKEMDAVKALEEAEHRYLGIFQNSAEGLYLFTRDGKLIDINPTACRFHGGGRNS